MVWDQIGNAGHGERTQLASQRTAVRLTCKHKNEIRDTMIKLCGRKNPNLGWRVGDWLSKPPSVHSTCAGLSHNQSARQMSSPRQTFESPNYKYWRFNDACGKIYQSHKIWLFSFMCTINTRKICIRTIIAN